MGENGYCTSAQILEFLFQVLIQLVIIRTLTNFFWKFMRENLIMLMLLQYLRRNGYV